MNYLKAEMGIIYSRYYKDVYNFCCGLCNKDPDMAEEITQNTFFKAIQSADSFRGNCAIKTWLCQIARNDYISRLRKDKHISKTETAEQLLENMADPQESTQTRLEDSESAIQISRILDGLDEPYGEVFRLRVLQDMDYKDIATIYKKSENWARVTYYRAKQKIIETMKQEGERI